MSEYNNEQLSALIDGEYEGNSNKAFDELIHSQEMKNTWSRYHLIGDCLREQLPEKVSAQISSRVSKALLDEPTILAPQKIKQFNLKPLAGFAIAASVAMAAVFTVQHSNETNSIPLAPSLADNTTVPKAQTYSFPEAQVLPAAVKKSDTPKEFANQRLNNYLMNHNEYRSNGSMNGILPYVRLVTIESQE
ncbi:MAG: anti-sigma-E factor RseA [marine bacterium B5-7]|nr:MAG: anti-sigma-E factor RseA [marine bacterium B5-7]